MAAPTNTLEIANILMEADVPRASAETLAQVLAEKFSQAASEEQLNVRLAEQQERSDARFETMLQHIDPRFVQIDARFAQIDARFAELEVKIYRAVAAGTALILAAISVWAAFG